MAKNQQEESPTALSGLQTKLHNQTHVRSDKEIMQAHVRSEFMRETGNVIKMIAHKKFGIQMVCPLICSKRRRKKKKIIEEMPGYVILWSITPPPTSCCPVSYSLIGCRLLLMYFSVRTNFTQQDFELRQVKIFSMPNILWVSAILSDRVIDNSHCVISHEQASFCLRFRAFVSDFAKHFGE